MRSQQREPIPERTRYTVALHAAGKTLTGIARAERLAPRYLHHVLAGQCPMSARVRAALMAAVGPDGWRYALGETDVLPCRAATGAVS